MADEHDSGNERGDEWLRREDADAADELAEAKADILGRIKGAGFNAVRIHHDGVGDSGQIQDIWKLDAKHNRVEPLREEGNITNDQNALVDALEAFAWKVLDAYEYGFENMAGGYGYITIDAATDEVSLVHTERFDYDEDGDMTVVEV